MKVLAINPDSCVGCKLCVLACSRRNARDSDPAEARIRVLGLEGEMSWPVTCFQCERPYCMAICPTRAITRESDTGVVRVSRDRCVKCKLCTIACPYGNMAFSGEDRVAVKCERCDGNPECVLFCPTSALEFKEADAATRREQAALSERLKAMQSSWS